MTQLENELNECYNKLLLGKAVKESYIQKYYQILYKKIIEYRNKNGECSFTEIVFLLMGNLKGSCKVCKGVVKFLSVNRGYREYCSKKCTNNDADLVKIKHEQYVKTCLEKYGTDNASKSDIVKEKMKESLKDVDYKEVSKKLKQHFTSKYGVDNPSKLDWVKEKKTITVRSNYGCDNPFQSEEIKYKLRQTNIEKYGFDHPLKSDMIKNKIKQTCVEKYGVDNPMQSEQVKYKFKETCNNNWGDYHFGKSNEFKAIMVKKHMEKLNNFHIVNNIPIIALDSISNKYKMFCGKCNTEFEIGLNAYNIRKNKSIEICTICCPVEHNRSALENDLALFIEENYNGELIRGKRFNNKELDIYLPELNIGIEFNGVYWHSEFKKENDYHLKKHQYFTDLDIQLIQVWEDDYNYKREIVESMLLNKLGKSNSIYGRKCIIKEVSNKDTVDFLNDNHIQGWCVSKIRYGLYYNDELVCLMTFGKNRLNLGGSSAESEFELLRFCNKLNTNVVGGSSKLLNYFIKVNNPKKITSYSKNDYSNGDLYKKLNFELISTSDANYYWVVDGIRVNRFNFRKDKLVKEGFDSNLTEVKIMHQRGYWRTFDSGNKKWIYFI
jgi:hypothetical protein